MPTVGKATGVVPPARIPANKVVHRPRGDGRKVWGCGEAALHDLFGFAFIMFISIPGLRARRSALAVAAALGCAAHAGAQGNAPPGSAAQTVLVSATRFDEDARNLPFGVSVITAADLARAGVSTVNEAIIKLLGVPGRQDFYGGGDFALDLRGFGITASSNQIVIVDGLRVNEGDESGARLAGIAIDTVERIEVLRGSGTVLYGEGGTGGVIVITTRAGRGGADRADRDKAADAAQGQVYAAGGSFNTREWRANATLGQGDLALDVAANQRKSDNHRANFASDVRGAAVGLQWRRDGLRLALRHAQDDLDGGLPGALSAAQYLADPHQASRPLDHVNLHNGRTTVLGEATLAGWQLALDAGWRDKALRSLSVSAFGPFAFDYDVAASNQALRARHTGPVAGLANSLVLGLDAGQWQRTVLGAFGSIARQRTLAWYARDELALAGGTRLSAGLRTESIRKDNSDGQGLQRRQNAWELGVVQALSADSSLYARVGDSFRLANADEYSYAQAGGDLRPQTSRDAELGLRWRRGGTRLEARAYRSVLRDEIGFDPLAFGPFDTTTATGANVNFAPTRRRGGELDLAHALSAALQLRANLAWRQARFDAGAYAGKRLPLTPRASASAGADWQPAAAHRVAATVVAVAAQHPDFNNACTMPAYATLDLRYAYQWAAGELSLGLANAADHRYYTQAFDCAGGVVTALYPEAGRNLTLAARWRF